MQPKSIGTIMDLVQAFSTTPGVNGTKAGWNAVYLMGDSNPGGTNPTSI
jgi:hypothetical protein